MARLVFCLLLAFMMQLMCSVGVSHQSSSYESDINPVDDFNSRMRSMVRKMFFLIKKRFNQFFFFKVFRPNKKEQTVSIGCFFQRINQSNEFKIKGTDPTKIFELFEDKIFRKIYLKEIFEDHLSRFFEFFSIIIYLGTSKLSTFAQILKRLEKEKV